MKIKCVSINSKLAAINSNKVLIIKEINKAYQNGFNYLVFAPDSLTGIIEGDLLTNKTLLEKTQTARIEITDSTKHLENLRIILPVFGRCFCIKNGFTYNITNFNYNEVFNIDEEFDLILNSELENLNNCFNRSSVIKNVATDGVCVYCSGRGFNSTTNGVYSNYKAICYNKYDFYIESNNDSIECDISSIRFNKKPYYPLGIPENDIFNKILDLQFFGLTQKMQSMNRHKIVLGVSGGLDSTVCLLSCVEIFKRNGWDLKDIIGISMPGLGTSERTFKNSLKLMKKLGITSEIIDLKSILQTHLKNIKQPKGKYDITYQQTQSRERTQVLLDYANKENAIMIGTGCMSEFALGWMTYGGDQLSMYALNVGLPKTVVKDFGAWYKNKYSKDLQSVINDIINTPVSPELLPLDKSGIITEKTEETIGDYLVQDFFIYHFIVNGLSITELFELTTITFPEYDKQKIFRWLCIFVKRFITRQYKKNCFGDGLQIFNYSINPKNGFKMASDVSIDIWNEELNTIKETLL